MYGHMGIILSGFRSVCLHAFFGRTRKRGMWHGIGMAGYCNCYLGIKYPTFNLFYSFHTIKPIYRGKFEGMFGPIIANETSDLTTYTISIPSAVITVELLHRIFPKH